MVNKTLPEYLALRASSEYSGSVFDINTGAAYIATDPVCTRRPYRLLAPDHSRLQHRYPVLFHYPLPIQIDPTYSADRRIHQTQSAVRAH